MLFYQSLFVALLSQYPAYHQIYTDGSKYQDKVASEAFSFSTTTAWLPNHSSIFMAELYAILLALRSLRSSSHHNFFLIHYQRYYLFIIVNFRTLSSSMC